MYKIALICEHGASTGMCVRKMIDASLRLGLDSEIASYSFSKLDNIIDDKDFILFGPQLSFKLDQYIKKHPEHDLKIAVVNSADFGMMNGEKILKDAIAIIERNRKKN